MPAPKFSYFRESAPDFLTCRFSAALAFLAAAAFFLCPAAGKDSTATPEQGLTVDVEGRLRLEGKPWRGLGVNYFDAFARLLREGKFEDVEAGFQKLATDRIPFVRFSACGFWPVDWHLYQTDRDEYFGRMDQVVKCAEKQEIGLIPSLFWHQPTVSDLVDEPVTEWGNPESLTIGFMRTYTREMVLRYRDSKSVWAWEFGNEFNLAADLPNAADHRAPIHPGLGTAATRSARDDLRHTDMRSALTEFAREVRRHDPHRLILSGNAFPRPSAWHQMNSKSWEKDSPEQWISMLAADNPAPIPTFSGRLYAPSDREILPTAMAQSTQDRKPLIIGEFGVPGEFNEDSKKEFAALLQALDQNHVPMAALWVYDFEGQAKTWNVTSSNARAEQLRLVSGMNARWQAEDAATRTENSRGMSPDSSLRPE